MLVIASALVALAGCGHDPASPTGAPGVPASLTFNFPEAEVAIGDSLQLSVVTHDSTGAVVPNVAVTWQSLNPVIATVSATGVVTAVDFGDTEIEADATAPGAGQARLDDVWNARLRSAVLAMLVAPIHAASPSAKGRAKIDGIPKVVVSPAAATILVSGKQEFKATFPGLTPKQIGSLTQTKWSSSNPAVAAIDIAGFATGKINGSTTITAAVTTTTGFVGGSTSTLTVSNGLCDGIALVPSFTADLTYDYGIEGSGDAGVLKIGSKYHGDVHAMLGNSNVGQREGTAVFSGPLTGTASQMETETDPSGFQDGLQGGTLVTTGGLSIMVLQVDLSTCNYNVQVVVTLNTAVTGTHPQAPFPQQSVTILRGLSKLSPRTPVPLEVPFFGHDFLDTEYDTRLSVPTGSGDFFVPAGLARFITGPLGKAGVGLDITCTTPSCS